MAIGIVAVSVLTVIGLLPHGLEVSRKTGDIAYKTRIFQQIASEYQAMPWSLVTGRGADKAFREFDYQGGAISSGANAGMLTYLVQTEVLSTPVTLSAVGGSGSNDNLRLLIVRIATTSERNFSFNDSSKSRLVATYSSLLAKSN